MINQPELITLILGFVALIYFINRRRQLRRLPFMPLVFFSYVLLLSGWIFTVAEGFLAPVAFNLAEHISYALAAIVLAVWCWKVGFGYRSNT